MKRGICIFLAAVMVLFALPPKAQAVQMDIKAKSAVLMDIATGTILYEQDAHTRLAPASVTKVMTLLLIMEAIDSGKIRWEDTVTASEAAAAKGGSQVYLKAGETMTVEDMVKSIAVSSANDCACAMAEHLAGSESAFVERMNAKAKELGMNDTHFVNCTGLDDGENAAEHLTCAHDIALMSRELLKNHPDITRYTTIWMDTIRGGAFGLSNTNKLIRFYTGATGLKTGFTAKAGYCLSASARRDGLELIAVVMGSETSQDRFAACKSLLDYGFANFSLYTPEIEEKKVPVHLGKASEVAVEPASETALLIDKGRRGTVDVRVELEEEAEAPVSRGQRLGEMTVFSGEQILAKVPMVARESVERLEWGDLFVRFLKRVAMGKAV